MGIIELQGRVKRDHFKGSKGFNLWLNIAQLLIAHKASLKDSRILKPYALLAALVISFTLSATIAVQAKKNNGTRDIINREGTRFSAYPQGAVVIDTSERLLYYMLNDGKAIRYRVAVGKPKMQWFGRTFVTMKRKNPGWTPTARMRRAGAPAYVPPGPKNPLGIRAIYLGWSEYRIHGTISPNSIGRAASSGCIRMLNRDVVDLFKRVHIGAPVDVIR